MSTRAQVLALAILGQLQQGPMHGYELRKQLHASLGAFRTLSYGSLYPALRSLTERGLIEATDGAGAPRPLSGRRGRIVYRLTEDGRHELTRTLATSGPGAWDDDAFDVRFALFGTTDAATRLRILEGRRTRMAERLEMLRDSRQRARDRMDTYTAELARHGLEQIEREVEWLESVIDTERGTRGALDYDALAHDHLTEAPRPDGVRRPPRPTDRPADAGGPAMSQPEEYS